MAVVLLTNGNTCSCLVDAPELWFGVMIRPFYILQINEAITMEAVGPAEKSDPSDSLIAKDSRRRQ
jgi:hypothetical protein